MSLEKLPERVRQKIEVGEEGCWVWVGFTNSGGYGRLWLDGGSHIAHRVIYKLLVGEIPEGLELDHLCRVRRCVNPRHLEPVTRAENIRRGARSHNYTGRCRKNLHDVTEDDSVYVMKDGSRLCKQCRKAGSNRNYRSRVNAKKVDHAESLNMYLDSRS